MKVKDILPFLDSEQRLLIGIQGIQGVAFEGEAMDLEDIKPFLEYEIKKIYGEEFFGRAGIYLKVEKMEDKLNV